MVGKGENAGNQHFLLFTPCFQLCQRKNFAILARFKLSSANDLNLDQSKILSFDKELTNFIVKNVCPVFLIPLNPLTHNKSLDPFKMKAFG